MLAKIPGWSLSNRVAYEKSVYLHSFRGTLLNLFYSLCFRGTNKQEQTYKFWWTYNAVYYSCELMLLGVRGVPGTEKAPEISVKTVRKFGKKRKTAQKWKKPRNVGILGTDKPHQKIASNPKTANLWHPPCNFRLIACNPCNVSSCSKISQISQQFIFIFQANKTIHTVENHSSKDSSIQQKDHSFDYRCDPTKRVISISQPPDLRTSPTNSETGGVLHKGFTVCPLHDIIVLLPHTITTQ